MTDARQRRLWHRAGPWAAIFVTVAAAAIVAEGCGGGDNPSSSASSAGGGGPTSTSTSTSTGMGGASTSSGTGGSSGITSIDSAADQAIALDATPDPDGKKIYFTAIGANGPGVFSVPADGSNPKPTQLAAGDPLSAPFGIAITSDGQQLFVADPGADTGNDKGAIYVVPVDGGSPTKLMGSDDMLPRGIEIVNEKSADVVYFTGTDKATGMPGVFKLPIAGGAAQAVATGAPFVDPSGITIATDGTIYVIDTIAAASHIANIIKVVAGKASSTTTDLRVGYPAGIALTLDEKKLYVSALDPATRTDAIAIVDFTTLTTSLFSKGVETYSEPAGMHRGKKVDVFAWADSAAGNAGGKVLVVH